MVDRVMVNEAGPQLGRKRDPSRDVAILDATLDVLANVGYAAMTVDMVASLAKAGKATVYRRWPSKDALILGAVAHMKRSLVDLDRLQDTGNLRGDLLALFRPRSVEDNARRLRTMSGLASMVHRHPELVEAVDDAIVAPWAQAHRLLIERAVTRGEISRPADMETVCHATAWMAAYRSMIQQKTFDIEFLTAIIDAVLLPALHSASLPRPPSASVSGDPATPISTHDGRDTSPHPDVPGR